ncbi:MAG: alpha/beta hydrolase-fold protein [Myxococcota bacterium]|jgi:predicted alpha/beta superfamily hydrolase
MKLLAYLTLSFLLALSFYACADDGANSGDTPQTEQPDTFEPDSDDPDVSDPGANAPDSDDSDTNDLDSDDSDISDTDTNDLDTNEPDTDVPPEEAAEQLARAAIAGTVDPIEAFIRISHGAGFPVKCQDGKYLFMHLHEKGPWSIAGDFNNWEAQAMTRSVDGLWYIELSISNPIGSAYKFIQRSTDIADPWARAYEYNQHGEASFVAPPQRAHLQRFRVFSGQSLKSRDIRVYVPGTEGPWSVLYVHDGLELLGAAWKLGDTMEEIQGDFLIVGIDNTDDRMEEYIHVDDHYVGSTWNAKGKEYADLVQTDLRPFIEKRFATKDLRGLLGADLGGLISLYIAHLYPDDYAFTASMSGTLTWGRLALNNTTMQELYEEAGKRDFIIYADSGGNEGDGCLPGWADALEDEESRDNYCATKAFVDALVAKGYELDKDLFYHHEPDAQPNEEAWAARVNIPLEIFKDLDEK